MRVVILCVLTGLMSFIAPSYGKDQQGWSAPAPNFRDKLMDYKYEIPDSKGKQKLDIPEVPETPQYYDYNSDVYSPRKFNRWRVSVDYTPAQAVEQCKLHSVAEDRWSVFRAFEHSVTYAATVKGTDEFSVYVPSQPHPKGTPVVFIDAQAFKLSPKTAKIFAPDLPTQKKMVQAMKTGTTMIVKWTEADGTRWEDRYPLAGVSEGFAELLRVCP